MNYRKKFLGIYIKAVDNYLKNVEFFLKKGGVHFVKVKEIIRKIPDFTTKNIFKITLVIFVIVFVIFISS